MRWAPRIRHRRQALKPGGHPASLSGATVRKHTPVELSHDTRDRTTTQLAGHYQGRYLRTAEGWRTCASTFTLTGTLLTSVADGMKKLMFMGAQASPDIDDPGLQA